jgi:hypothetical protein
MGNTALRVDPLQEVHIFLLQLAAAGFIGLLQQGPKRLVK